MMEKGQQRLVWQLCRSRRQHNLTQAILDRILR